MRAAFNLKGRARMVSAAEIVALEDRLTREWHEPAEAPGDGPFPAPTAPGGKLGGAGGDWLSLVARQHKANFDLWHIEDEARTPGASSAQIADVKRRIDRTNQLRNDLMEELDQAMQIWLEGRGQRFFISSKIGLFFWSRLNLACCNRLLITFCVFTPCFARLTKASSVGLLLTVSSVADGFCALAIRAVNTIATKRNLFISSPRSLFVFQVCILIKLVFPWRMFP